MPPPKRGYDACYSADEDPVPFLEDVVRCLNKKGFCKFYDAGSSEEELAEALKDVEGLEEWSPAPAELTDALLGPDGSGRMARFKGAGESPLSQMDSSVSLFLGWLSQWAETLVGCSMGSRTDTVIVETGTPSGSFPHIKESMAWLETLTWQRLMILRFLGPGSGTLTMKPFDEEAESFETRLEPGMWVLLRADALSHSLIAQSTKAYTLASYFLEDLVGPARNVSFADKSPPARDLETKILEFVRKAKETAEDEDAFQLMVTREFQRSANHLFHKGDQIAVRGQSVRAPAELGDYDDFWRVVYTGVDAAIQIPLMRWDYEKYYLPDPDSCLEARKSYQQHACFFEGADIFDNKFFGISVMEAKGMDPNQRLILETAYQALSDAGWTKKTLGKSWTGVCIGAYAFEYEPEANMNEDAMGGTSGSLAIVSNRISYVLGLMGPSFSIDLESAASMVALVTCCDQVQHGKPQADQSLAGGVECVCHPRPGMYMCWAGLLSYKGRCAVFDDCADGFIRGECVGSQVVSPLMQQIDGEWVVDDSKRVDGIISAGISCHSGKGANLGAPSGASDLEMLHNCIRRACIDPLDVDAIDCYGLAQVLHDAVEVSTLSKVYRGTPTDEMFALTSSKCVFGNCGRGGGVVSIMKALGITHWGTVSPTIHLHQTNPHTDLADDSATVYATESLSNRMFSSFIGSTAKSWSGSNAHVIFHGSVDSNKLQQRREARDAAKELVYWPGGGGLLDRTKRPLREYTIAGSWSGWESQTLTGEGRGTYSFTITLGENGFERFQILLDGDYNRVLHPNMQEGGKDVEVHGPDTKSDCFGSCWQIDGRYKLQWQDQPDNALTDGSDQGVLTKVGGPDAGAPGDQYKIKLETLGKYRVITWEKLVDEADGTAIRSLVPEGRYSVIGSFTEWKAQEMKREDLENGARYVCEVKLTQPQDADEFQIVVDEDSRRILYPEFSGSGPGPCKGPDELGAGYTWKMQGTVGDLFRIVLERTVRSGVMVSTVKWENIGHEVVETPTTSYYVIGDWDSWAKPLKMTAEDDRFVLRRTLPASGTESFVILHDGSYSSVFSPSMSDANPYSFHVLRGPSPARGHYWTVGSHPTDEYLRGDPYEIVLKLSDGATKRPKKVIWNGVEM